LFTKNRQSTHNKAAYKSRLVAPFITGDYINHLTIIFITKELTQLFTLTKQGYL
jgi:hypothetical protein